MAQRGRKKIGLCQSEYIQPQRVIITLNNKNKTPHLLLLPSSPLPCPSPPPLAFSFHLAHPLLTKPSPPKNCEINMTMIAIALFTSCLCVLPLSPTLSVLPIQIISISGEGPSTKHQAQDSPILGWPFGTAVIK